MLEAIQKSCPALALPAFFQRLRFLISRHNCQKHFRPHYSLTILTCCIQQSTALSYLPFRYTYCSLLGCHTVQFRYTCYHLYFRYTLYHHRPSFNDKGPHLLLWAGSRPASGKIAVSGTHNRLNYCITLIVHTSF